MTARLSPITDAPDRQPPTVACTPRERDALTHALLNRLDCAVLVEDAASGVYIFANAPAQELTGMAPADVVGRTGAELFPHCTALARRIDLAFDAASGIAAEQSLTRPDGSEIIVEIKRHLVEMPDQGIRYVFCLIDDVTERAAVNLELERLARHDSLTGLANRAAFIERLETALAACQPIALMSIDLDCFKSINDRFGHVIGDGVLIEVAERLRGALAVPGCLAARVGGDEFALLLTGEAALAQAPAIARGLIERLDGPFDVSGASVMMGASIGIAFAPEHAATTTTLRHCADLGLYRAKHTGKGQFCIFDPILDATEADDGTLQISAFPRQPQPALGFRGVRQVEAAATDRIYLAIAGINRFAKLRKRVGYIVANTVIDQLAERIRQTLSGIEIGRIGRTTIEFVFTAPSPREAHALLTGVIAALEAPFVVDDCAFDLSITIGASESDELTIGDQQLDAAAAALSEAEARREKILIASAEESVATGFDELILIRDLRQALLADELVLHYQPKLHAREERIHSVEGLLRWFHHDLGLISTMSLIELAEATGAIHELTRWVVERAIADQRTLAAAGHPLTVYVNLSGLVLADPAFTDWVLERLGPNPRAIGIEITETAVIEDPSVAIRNLERFAQAGISIAIDDYGSGLSSLAYLRQLPANELKIDRMFVSRLTDTHRDPLLVRSSIDLAHALEMVVTAEGVEDPMALSLLRIMGCDLIQGYLISKPLPLASLLEFLDEGEFCENLALPPHALSAWGTPASV